MRAISPEHTVPRVMGHHGNRYVMSDYIGSMNAADRGPQAYLVRQESRELRAHFHEVDQFQVVIDGTGTLGRDAAAPGTLHYTDAWTTYGPIRTDPAAGLAYFTLRATATTGINYMPEEREKRAREQGRSEHFTCQVPPGLGPEPVELARTGRGARALAWRPVAGSRLAWSEPSGVTVPPASGEGYVVLLRGTLRGPEGELPPGSLLHFDTHTELASVLAGEDTEVAVLLFPPGH